VNTLALIPARGGSKGIPRKNLQELGGIPLLAHTILQAIRCPQIDRVVCSTDDEEIATIARRYGADISVRPAHLATDTASTDAVIMDYIERELPRPYSDSIIVLLQATSPFRTPEDIRAAVAEFERQQVDSLLTVTATHRFRWTWEADGAGARSEDYDPRARPRRQDLPTRFQENGSIYIARAAAFKTERTRLPGSIGLYVMPEPSALEIDSPWDLDAARALWPGFTASCAQPDLAGAKHLVLDCDGVLTDNRVHVDSGGRESVSFHRGDGHGLSALLRAGVPVTVVSRERSSALEHRCRKLGLNCVTGSLSKDEAMMALSAQGLALEDTVYVGNDLPDLAAMRLVGHPIAVSDAHPRVLAAARHITTRAGGHGAVREVCEWMRPLT
jgi:YrbI family 3-deoxy-D-manno-octulosonate 8-phosphate phosphatase